MVVRGKDVCGFEKSIGITRTCLNIGNTASSRNRFKDLNNKSRMTGDCQVRFCERLEVKFLWATRHCFYNSLIDHVNYKHDRADKRFL